jgi:hypothetical protein
MGDVERAAAAAAVNRIAPWAVSLREQLIRLLAAFDYHILVTEADDGLLEEVVDVAPRLAHRANQLRSDHATIRGLIEKVITDLDRPEFLDEAGVGRVRELILDLLRQIGHHRHLGADLIYQAYNLDIEASD